MKTNIRYVAVLCCVLISFAITSCNQGTNPATDSVPLGEEHNKAIVVQYFQKVIDEKQINLMPELFTRNVVVHRPEGTLTYVGVVQAGLQKALSQGTIETTIHEMISSGDTVSVRLSHQMTASAKESYLLSRIGRLDVRGKVIEWEAMAWFRFENGKIAEEWVSNDELGQLLQIGTLELKEKGN